MSDTRVCKTCGEVKDVAGMSRGNGGALRPRCKKCVSKRARERRIEMYGLEGYRAKQNAYNANRKPRDRASAALGKYGMNMDDWDRLAEAQGECCAICRRHMADVHADPSAYRKLAVDHCHVTRQVRGLLCLDCNLALGRLRDDPELMRRAAEYVESGGVPLAQESRWVAKPHVKRARWAA